MDKKTEALKLALEALKELKAVMPIFPKDGDCIIGYKDRYNAAQYQASNAIAAAKQALEQPAKQCKYGNEPVSCTSSPMDCQCALDAVFEQPAQQEPVAVYVGETWCGSVVRLYDDLPLETLLYTAPPASKSSKEDALYETFAKIVAYLGIDTEAARSAPGKPSDVFIAAIKKREAPQRNSLTDERAKELWDQSRCAIPRYLTFKALVEAEHGIKEKNNG